jgi:hypothetical protein
MYVISLVCHDPHSRMTKAHRDILAFVCHLTPLLPLSFCLHKVVGQKTPLVVLAEN